MKRNYQLISAALILFILIIAFFWLRPPSWLAGNSVFTSLGWGKAKITASPPKPIIPIATQLETICSELQASKDSATTRQLLANLRNLLNSLPPSVASHEIQAFLSTGKDAATHLDLTIKPRGILGDSSSLRVFLLDYLGVTDPPAASLIASQILSHYSTPDEWAVSLRNYAWANPGPDSRTFLQSKVKELLGNQAWLNDPSTGFLEAFDTVVYTHDTSLTPQLSAILQNKDNPAAAHAAYLTLDRLVIDDPVPVLKQIIDESNLMQGHEKTRADYVARADLGQADQRALVEQYLLDPTRDPSELATFAATFPNANFMISDNLLTTVQTPTSDQLVQRDQDALKVVEQWQSDPRFKDLKPLLTQMHDRLGIFVNEARASSR